LIPAVDAHLNNHHRDTVRKLFEHPPSENIEWREVESLLEAVGTVTREPNGKLAVTVGPESEVFHTPHGKDVDRQTIVDLRRMLENAGYSPDHLPLLEVGEPGAEPLRDEGDSRRGAP
jgi:hypothetical protein